MVPAGHEELYDRVAKLEKQAKTTWWGWVIMCLPIVMIGVLILMINGYEQDRYREYEAFVKARIEFDAQIKTTVDKLWGIWGQ